MPIPVSDIVSFMASALDAEASDRYLFNQDYKPAINGAIDVAVALFNQAFAEKKLSPEQLRELTKVGVWQANQYSRVAYQQAEVGFPFWTVVAVYPKPVTNINPSSVVVDKSASLFKKDISYISSTAVAKRLTLEEWNDNKRNAFMPGNTLLQGSTVSEYAYLDFANYGSTSYTGNNGEPEIEVGPPIPGELVAISFLKVPKKVTAQTDTIEFPSSLTQMITDIALNQIAVKQNDQTTLYAVSAVNVQKLTSLMR